MKTWLVSSMLLLAVPSLARAADDAPQPTPAVSPIATFQEKKAAPAATATEKTPLETGVRIDKGGMFGLGGAIGNTSTGITSKVWFSQDLSAQFGAGAGPIGNNVRFQLDVLFVYYRFDSPDGQYSLPFYAGLGGQAGIFFKDPSPADRTDIGARLPLGMSVVVPNNPVELFFEIAPDAGFYRQKETVAAGAGFKTETKTHPIVYVDGQIGARFYF